MNVTAIVIRQWARARMVFKEIARARFDDVSPFAFLAEHHLAELLRNPNPN